MDMFDELKCLVWLGLQTVSIHNPRKYKIWGHFTYLFTGYMHKCCYTNRSMHIIRHNIEILNKDKNILFINGKWFLLSLEIINTNKNVI